jgi:metallo-beta-lactamase class B
MRRITTTAISLLLLTRILGQTKEISLKISHLTGNFYVYTTYNLYKGNRISANGMYLVTNNGVVIFDTPWDTTQFQPLLDSIKFRHNEKVILCISTDFHEDRTGGLEYYRKQGIKTYTTKQIDELSVKRGMKRAEFLIYNDTSFAVGQYTFQTFFPGQGHTAVNIVVWFEAEKILYGGCLIKSAEDKNLGYLGDANVKDYATTIKNVQQKFPHPKVVFVGHGDWTSPNSLEHTLDMAEQLKKKNYR